MRPAAQSKEAGRFLFSKSAVYNTLIMNMLALRKGYNLLVRAISHPDKAAAFAQRKMNTLLVWEKRYESVREPKTHSAIAQSAEIAAGVRQELSRLTTVTGLQIDPQRFREYLRRAEYERYKWYFYGPQSSNVTEKSLEHYLAAELLEIGRGEKYIDVGSADSPTPYVYERLFGCQAYRQDLSFPPGLSGRTIGGDAAAMPMESDSIDKMALHCTFEHFEGDSDLRFIREAARVLRPGGRLCILPLYLSSRHAIQTDLATLRPDEMRHFDDDAVLYCAKGWGNRHGRFYSPASFQRRILENLRGLNLKIFFVENLADIDRSCYVRFVALFEKPPAGLAARN